MIKAQCIRDCTWRGRYWKAGEMYAGTETPPLHFKAVEPEPESEVGQEVTESTPEAEPAKPTARRGKPKEE